MPHDYAAISAATPSVAWRLIAEPRQWHRWAPHIRGGRGLGSPEIEAGATGFVIVAPVLPVPVRIIAKDPGRSWDWRVGPAVMRHEVIPLARGCEVRVELRAPGPIELALHAGYGPLMSLAIRNLARVASATASRGS